MILKLNLSKISNNNFESNKDFNIILFKFMELKKTKIKCYTIQINKMMWFKDLFSKK